MTYPTTHFNETVGDLIKSIAYLRFQLAMLPEGSPAPDAARQIAQVRHDLQTDLGECKLLLDVAIHQKVDEEILCLTEQHKQAKAQK
jgi:hypothetical protein